jgi:transcriptional regulator with GAF, ATPase, and Fis domain
MPIWLVPFAVCAAMMAAVAVVLGTYCLLAWVSSISDEETDQTLVSPHARPHHGQETITSSPPHAERSHIVSALVQTRGNLSKAAKLLGMSRAQLHDELTRRKGKR